MRDPWLKWVFAESVSKTIGRSLLKFVGVSGGSLASVLVVVLVTGIIQMNVGWHVAKMRGEKNPLKNPGWPAFGSVIFGLTAALMLTLGAFAFTYPGAEVGLTTFIVTMSIIPGAFVDRLFFGTPITTRVWIGIAVFLAAGYATLDFPSLGVLLTPPVWVWITLLGASLSVVNEAVTRKLGLTKTSGMTFNFWVGLAKTLMALAGLSVSGGWVSMANLSKAFWLAAVVIALNEVAMNTAKLFAYEGGVFIALKKVAERGFYLVLAIMAGWIFYGEEIGVGKALGVLGFAAAFALMDHDTWRFVTGRIGKSHAVERDGRV
jgi:hypothetical protein